MKKVLIVFDGEHFSKGAFDFACHMNETNQILLVGLFLPSVDYTDVMLYYLGGMAGPLYPTSLETDTTAIAQNVDIFKALCLKNKIEYRVHTEIVGTILEGIQKETRYADLLIIGEELFYNNLGSSSQEVYLKDTMHRAECPVIVVPETYIFPNSLIMAYDGTQSSIYAIKQFINIFPEMLTIKTLIVYSSTKKDDIPDIDYMEEFAARHFKDLTFFKLEADPEKYFNTWMMDRGSAMLVTGSYGRSSLSEIFKKNFVTDIIKDHKLPVFITHL